MQKFQLITLMFMLSSAAFSQQPALVLHDGTPVKLRLSRNLSSADAKVGESVDFEVLEDVKANETLLIARGSVALGTVTQAVPKRRMARGGKLDVNIDHVRLINEEKVALRAVKETKGGGHTGAMTAGIVATSIVFFPAAPLFLFMHGKDITIPKGTEITAYVNGEINLDAAKFAPKVPVAVTAAVAPLASAPPVTPSVEPSPAPSSVVTLPGAAKALTNADVIALKDAGLSDDLVVSKIRSAPGAYSLNTDDLIALKKAGISEAVIAAMLGRAN